MLDRVQGWLSDRYPVGTEDSLTEQDESELPDIEPDKDYPTDLEEAEQYFGIDAERHTDEYWAEVTDAAYAAAKQQLEAAYEHEIVDDSDGLRYLENFAEPAFRRFHGLDDGPTRIDLTAWAQHAYETIDDHYMHVPGFPHHGFHKGATGKTFEEFYDHLAETYEEDEFDQVVGVHSSGLPFLAAAGSYFDADEIVVRYSHLRCDDEEVLMTDSMEERADFDGAELLVVDDIIESGRTVREVGDFLYEQGADRVIADEAERVKHVIDHGPDGETEVSAVWSPS
ncbi:MAG: phosphoribosyltransferase [Candidatus Nanohaloarchaea archaeon]|nr:phosphoribosyltransferase [Candidatus Nanohaloarchaea archaeon]